LVHHQPNQSEPELLNRMELDEDSKRRIGTEAEPVDPIGGVMDPSPPTDMQGPLTRARVKRIQEAVKAMTSRAQLEEHMFGAQPKPVQLCQVQERGEPSVEAHGYISGTHQAHECRPVRACYSNTEGVLAFINADGDPSLSDVGQAAK